MLSAHSKEFHPFQDQRQHYVEDPCYEEGARNEFYDRFNSNVEQQYRCPYTMRQFVDPHQEMPMNPLYQQVPAFMPPVAGPKYFGKKQQQFHARYMPKFQYERP